MRRQACLVANHLHGSLQGALRRSGWALLVRRRAASRTETDGQRVAGVGTVWTREATLTLASSFRYVGSSQKCRVPLRPHHSVTPTPSTYLPPFHHLAAANLGRPHAPCYYSRRRGHLCRIPNAPLKPQAAFYQTNPFSLPTRTKCSHLHHPAPNPSSPAAPTKIAYLRTFLKSNTLM